MLYLLQCQIYAGVLYMVYYTLLRDHASHRWNRLFLLLCAVLPLVLPFIHIPGINSGISLNTDRLSYVLPDIVVSSKHHEKIYAAGFILDDLFTFIYFSGAAILLIQFSLQYLRFRRFAATKKYELLPGNTKVIMNSGYGPGSFGSYIFFPGNEADPTVLQHELAHVQHRHSRDVLFVKLLQCLFWPNIMLYAIMKELKTVHEFEADTLSSVSREDYIHSLLNGVFNTNHFSLSHTFFHHPIKRRIVMLQKTPQSQNKLRTAITGSGITALILTAGLIYLQSCNRQPNIDRKLNNTNNEQLISKIAATEPTLTAPVKDDDGIYKFVEHMPESSVDIISFLGKNIKYPDDARKNGIEGRVVIRFIVDEEGNMKAPEVMKSPAQSLSDEAVRVLMTMPKWKPGTQDGKNVPVYFTIPISFKLG